MNPIAKKHEPIIKVIAHCIENDEAGIRNLLKRNGVDVTLIKTKQDLRKAFVNALAKSKVLALEFNRYLELKKSSSSDLNASEREQVIGLDLDGLSKPATQNWDQITTTVVPTSSGSSSNTPSMATTDFGGSGGFFSGLNLKDLLNTGVNVLELQRDVQLSKDNANAIENAVKIKQNEINLQPNSPKSSTGVYVAVGIIVVVLIGGIIYFVKKK